MRVALFVTCLADTLYPDVGKATVRLLERLGHRVEFPLAQTCCGQMHVNTGYLRDALPLVRRYAEVFGGYEAVVVPSGSCTGSVRHQHAMVARRYGDGDRPLRLLRHVDGLDLVELPDAEVCCGFGGTFAVKNADVSTAMLADKMRGVLATRAA